MWRTTWEHTLISGPSTVKFARLLLSSKVNWRSTRRRGNTSANSNPFWNPALSHIQGKKKSSLLDTNSLKAWELATKPQKALREAYPLVRRNWKASQRYSRKPSRKTPEALFLLRNSQGQVPVPLWLNLLNLTDSWKHLINYCVTTLWARATALKPLSKEDLATLRGKTSAILIPSLKRSRRLTHKLLTPPSDHLKVSSS